MVLTGNELVGPPVPMNLCGTPMTSPILKAFLFLIIATTLEASGDALLRRAIYEYVGVTRLGFFAIGATLLLGYGTSLNLAPLEFSQVVGLYIATLFVVWQVVNFVTFKSLPSAPIIFGGLLIVIGGLVVTFWRA